MTRSIAIGFALFAASAAAAFAATGPSRPTLPQAPSVARVLARSGVEADAPRPDWRLAEAGADDEGAAAFAAQRAAIRACHAERYAASRENVLQGRATPLGAC